MLYNTVIRLIIQYRLRCMVVISFPNCLITYGQIPTCVHCRGTHLLGSCQSRPRSVSHTILWFQFLHFHKLSESQKKHLRGRQTARFYLRIEEKEQSEKNGKGLQICMTERIRRNSNPLAITPEIFVRSRPTRFRVHIGHISLKYSFAPCKLYGMTRSVLNRKKEY